MRIPNYKHPTLAFKALILFLSFVLISLISGSGFVHASYDGVLDGETLQTNPKPRDVTVSAIMPDVLAPSNPVLITPADQSLLNQQSITFSWSGSVDNVAIDHYQLWLNGSLYLDNLPLTSTGTQNYTLTVDPINNLFYLLLQPPLTDGAYTWKVVALDASSNSSASETWSFTLDTQAPIFVINKVDTTVVTISATDTTTLPNQPIEISHPDPWLDGIGEALSQVKMELGDKNGNINQYNFLVDSQGHWQINLGFVLEKDVIYYLDFLIIDQAGNSSKIHHLPIIWPTQYYQVGVPAIIAPPSPTTQKTEIKLKKITPNELKVKLFKTLKNFFPPKAQKLLTSSLFQINIINRRFWFTSWLTLLMFFAPFIIFVGWCLIELRKPFARLTWQTIFWLFFPKKDNIGGITFSWPSLEAVQFAKIKIVKTHRDKPMSFYTMSNTQGFFPKIRLDRGEYYLDINHQHISFPTLTLPPKVLKISDFYRQEVMHLNQEGILLPLIIPVDITQTPLNSKIKLKWFYLTQMKGRLVPGYIGAMVIITLFFTSWINILSLLIYLSLTTKQALSS